MKMKEKAWEQDMKLHFLKTHWSDMILLESRGRYALVDTGFEEQYEQLTDYLDRLGVETLSLLLLTHFHRDHYGNICRLLTRYRVERVYFREYGGHDRLTAWGTPADDAYRQAERERYNEMRDCICKNSTLYMAEETNTIDFDGYTLQLYGNINTVARVFEDASVPETYHQNAFSENQNSLAVFFEADGRTVFLGGDMMDEEAAHPLANRQTTESAKRINRRIDVYKAPHHGTNHTAQPEALAIFRPGIAVITNAMEWLCNYDTIDSLRKANPAVDIRLTDADVVVDLSEL